MAHAASDIGSIRVMGSLPASVQQEQCGGAENGKVHMWRVARRRGGREATTAVVPNFPNPAEL